MFSKVPLSGLGSMAVAIQPVACGTLRKHVTKPSEQVTAPECRMWNLYCGGINYFMSAKRSVLVYDLMDHPVEECLRLRVDEPVVLVEEGGGLHGSGRGLHEVARQLGDLLEVRLQQLLGHVGQHGRREEQHQFAH